MIDLKPACHRMADLLAGVTDDQLTGPTPCAEYTVADLVTHVDGVAQGFASLARRTGGEQAELTFADGWPDGTAEHVRALGEAWDDTAAWEGSTAVAADLALPNELWGRISLTEMVVHGWDLARATGQPFALPEETLLACLDHVTEFVPKAPVPELWGTPAQVADDAPLIDRIVAVTGRTP
ncbi:TIGR03086 family metal-binding protein [Amycolatopsis minnesotensis]|uniref:TIGR03086 family metal-binding protein n=1 Tax=Amycolatopsis minnesotensis TaxID=337894 RepID=A0ABN2SNW1_9PSEU